MKTLNSNTKYKFNWPKFTFAERMSLLGYAKYMGYEFDYNPDKRKAILIKIDGENRRVLFLQKINGKIIGIDRDGNREILNPEIFLSKLLFKSGVFAIPDEGIGINQFIKDNLQTLVYD